VGVQEVRWNKGGTEQAENYAFLSLSLFGKGSENHQLEKGFLVHQRTVPAVKRVELVSDRMSYIVYVLLNVHCCAIMVLSVQSSTKDTSNDIKDSFYEE
jgi:hypothetical protein